MPTPREGESREDFVERCIPIVIEDGTASTPDQAIAVCNSMWESDEKAVPDKYSHIDFTPSETVQKAYRNGLERHENGETGDGLESITVRMARAFANGEATTPKWARKGNRWWGRFGNRAEAASPGEVMYANKQLWGGRNWFAPIVEKMDAADEGDKAGGKMNRQDMEHKTFPAMVVKADEASGIVETIFAVMGNIDYGRDVIHPGAFTKTFLERGGKVKVLDHHRAESIMNVIGKPVAFRELPREELPKELLAEHPEAIGGAFARVQMLMDTPEGRGAFARLASGAVDEWSFGYDALDADFSKAMVDGEEVTVRNLRTIKLWEISPVIWGMNDATMTTGAKENPGVGERDLGENADPQERKIGRAISAANEQRIMGVIDGIDSALDELRGLVGMLDEVEEEPMDDEDETEEMSDDAPATERAATKTEAGPQNAPTSDDDWLDRIRIAQAQLELEVTNE